MSSIRSTLHSEDNSKRDVFESTFTGAQQRPFIPRLRSDPPSYHPIPHSLLEFRRLEGREGRKQNLRELWKTTNERLKASHASASDDNESLPDPSSLTSEQAKHLKDIYDTELVDRLANHPSSSDGPAISWLEFKQYALAKEAELWTVFHDQLDLDGNGHIESDELYEALSKAGIELSPTTLSEFMASLTSSPHCNAINFSQFRDFLLLLPRPISTMEIFRYYKVRNYMGDDGRGGAARVNMEGDVSLSAEDVPSDYPAPKLSASSFVDEDEEGDYLLDDEDEDEEPQHHRGLSEGHTALRFLLAGGIAGAVSRTCTAPFDRLKIFLITRPPDLGGPLSSSPTGGVKILGSAVSRIYSEGGVLAFWTGNGLSVAKIFPESAIKFFTYESSKRAFAKYYDHVEDSREISGISRFLSGGMGGITSQLSIYPIETLKTHIMSNTGAQKRTLTQAIKHVWTMGGVRAYYRGLTIGLLGVFPYSAIDMSTFEALKLAYLRSTNKEEPGVLALLAFGSISGSVGATSVYPLNLVRTRLQASGSPGHPTRYTGMWDVVQKTMEHDGWRGFYRGLFPTLAKVVPAVSISYVVYERSKRSLGV